MAVQQALQPQGLREARQDWVEAGNGPVGHTLHTSPLFLYICFSKVSVTQGLWAEG